MSAPGARGHDKRRSGRQSDQREGGHFPVPIERRVGEEGDVRTGRGRHERFRSYPWNGRQRHGKRQTEYDQPDRPELSEYLQIEVVRIADVLVDGAPGQPQPLEASCARPVQRLVP